MIHLNKYEAAHLIKTCCPINKEFEIKGRNTRLYCDDAIFIECVDYTNQKVISKHAKERLEIKYLIKNNNVDIKYYNNFIEISGKTFNGWTREGIFHILKELYSYKPSKYDIFDYEEEDE